MSTTSDPPIEPTGSKSSRRKWGILSPRNVILLLLPSFPLQHPPSNRTTRGSIFSIGKCSFSIEWRWTGPANVLSRQSSHIEWIGSWLTGWKGVVGLMDRKDNRTPHSHSDGVVQLHITMGDDDTTSNDVCRDDGFGRVGHELHWNRWKVLYLLHCCKCNDLSIWKLHQ